MGKKRKQRQTLFWRAPKALQTVMAAMKLKGASPQTETAHYKVETLLWGQRDIAFAATVKVRVFQSSCTDMRVGP